MVELVFAPEGRLILARHFRAGWGIEKGPRPIGTLEGRIPPEGACNQPAKEAPSIASCFSP
jgi:hypothetical protein